MYIVRIDGTCKYTAWQNAGFVCVKSCDI